MHNLGKWLIITGLFITAVGAGVILLEKTGLFKLPGDINFGSGNWRIFFPITSCIIISVVLTLLLWIINYFLR